MRRTGPGTHLKNMLSKLGFGSSSSCNCRRIMEAMDRDGPDKVSEKREHYANWILQSAKHQEWDFESVAESRGLKKLFSAASVVTLSVAGVAMKRRVVLALLDRAVEKSRHED